MIRKISVIGAGTMGHGIASAFARFGYEVSIYESFESVRLTCKDKIRSIYEFFVGEGVMSQEKLVESLNNIEVFDDLKKSVYDADYVIEAIPEKLELKQELFDNLVKFCKKNTVFASNTSSLPFNKLTEKLSVEDKKRVMVCHWYNPPHLIPLVELSHFGNMPEEVYEEVRELYISIEKKPAKVLKDVPGLLANRIQQGVAREVFSLMANGIGDAEDIDIALKYGPAFRYATTGQLEVADFGGLDIWAVVGDNLLSVMDNSKEASPLLREKVKEGKLGFKSGEGFFKYPDDKKQEVLDKFYKKLLKQLEVSKNYD